VCSRCSRSETSGQFTSNVIQSRFVACVLSIDCRSGDGEKIGELRGDIGAIR
jgi:hypothetical protein